MLEDIVQTAKGFLLSPAESFKAVGEKSLGASYRYYVSLLVIFTILYGIVTLIVGALMFNSYVQQLAMVPIIGKALSLEVAKFGTFVMVAEVFYVYLVFLALLFGIFISGLILHLFVLLMDGKKGWRETVKTAMYASTPALLLGWIPIISIIGSIWSLILLILGFRDNNGLSFEKSVAVVVIPIVLVLILLILGIAVVVTLIGTFVSILPKSLLM